MVSVSAMQRAILRDFEQIEDFIIEPGVVTEFERGAHRRKLAQE